MRKPIEPKKPIKKNTTYRRSYVFTEKGLFDRAEFKRENESAFGYGYSYYRRYKQQGDRSKQKKFLEKYGKVYLNKSNVMIDVLVDMLNKEFGNLNGTIIKTAPMHIDGINSAVWVAFRSFELEGKEKEKIEAKYKQEMEEYNLKNKLYLAEKEKYDAWVKEEKIRKQEEKKRREKERARKRRQELLKELEQLNEKIV